MRAVTTRTMQRLSSAGTRRPTGQLAAQSDATDGNAMTIAEEACLALTTAGFRSREARAAVESASLRVRSSATLEEVIREALRQFGSVATGFR